MQIWISIPTRAAQEGVNPCTIWRRIKAGLLPPPVKTGPNSTRLFAGELEIIDQAILSGATESEIKALVRNIVAARQVAA